MKTLGSIKLKEYYKIKQFKGENYPKGGAQRVKSKLNAVIVPVG